MKMNIFYKKIVRKEIGLIVLAVLLIFGTIQFSFDNLRGNDSFYHLKMAGLMQQHLIYREFPYIYTSVLHDTFYDMHFGFHLYLLPFTIIIPDLITAGKLANLVLLSLLFITSYLIFEHVKSKQPLLLTIFFMVMSSFFMGRITVIKATPLGILFYMLGVWLFLERKWLMLFFISLLFVYSYQQFPVFVLLILILGIAQYFIEGKTCLKSIGAILGGTIVGLIINPFFPHNLSILWIQYVKGVLFRPELFITIAEHSPMNISTFFFQVLLIFVIIGGSFLYWKQLSKKTFLLLVLSAVTVLFAFIYVRMLDFFYPTAIFYIALVSADIKSIKKIIPYAFILLVILAGWNTYYVSQRLNRQYDVAVNSLKQEYSLKTTVKQCADYLSEHSEPGAVVFLWNYEDFSPLFFYNSHNAYTLGLDPVFTWAYSKDIYQKYAQIAILGQFDNAVNIIDRDFKASFIFIPKFFWNDGANLRLEEISQHDDRIKLGFTNDYCVIWIVP